MADCLAEIGLQNWEEPAKIAEDSFGKLMFTERILEAALTNLG
jgi:hypothetical protein